MILITRPELEAKELSKILSNNKIANHIDSCIAFEDIDITSVKFDSDDFLISSKQAAYVLDKNNLHVKRLLSDGNFFIIGESVKTELIKIGIKKIEKTFNNIDEFINYLPKKKKVKSIQFLSGNIINEEAKELIEENVLKQTILYNVVPAQKLSDQTVHLINNGEIKSAVMFSKFTSTTFNNLVIKHNVQKMASEMTYICISEKVADHMRNMGYSKCQFSHKPNRNSVIDCIKEYIY